MMTAPQIQKSAFQASPETVVRAMVGDGAILLAGVCETLTGRITIAAEGSGEPEPGSVLLTWGRPDAEPGAALGFLALLPAMRNRNGRPRSVMLAAGPRKLRFDVAARLIPAATLLQAVAGEAGSSFAALPDMLVEMFLAKPGSLTSPH